MQFWLAVVDTISALSNLLIASFLTALGALIAIWLAQRERQRQRVHDLRQEVYLPAVQATVEMLGTIAGIMDLRNAESGYMKTSQQFGAAMARVFMVASDDTIPKVARLQRAVMREFFESISIRQSLAKRQSQIDEISQMRLQNQQEVARYIEMMKAMNIEQTRDAGRFAAIEMQAKHASQLAENQSAALAPLDEAHGAEFFRHIRALPDRMDPLADLYVEALTAIRLELKIRGSADVLQAELRLNAIELRFALEKGIQRLDELYGIPKEPKAE